MIDDRTAHADLPLPHPSNDLADDVLRLRSAFSLLDGLLAGIGESLQSLHLFDDGIEEAFGNLASAVEGLGTAASAAVTESASDATAGRLLKVGDFGAPNHADFRHFATDGSASTDTDWNSVAGRGLFRMVLRGNAPNGPGGNGYFYPLVFQANADTLTQFALPYSTGTVNRRLAFRTQYVGTWSGWTDVLSDGDVSEFAKTLMVAANAAAARELLGVSVYNPLAGSSLVDLGERATAGSESVSLDLSVGNFFYVSMATANTTGTLSLNVENMQGAGKIQSWHVLFRRGGRKVLAISPSVTWAGGVAPLLGSGNGNYDLVMFWQAFEGAIMRAMLVDSW